MIKLVKIVKLLHANGAAVDVYSTNHRTPLHVAAYYGHKDIGKLTYIIQVSITALVEYLIKTDMTITTGILEVAHKHHATVVRETYHNGVYHIVTLITDL